MLNITILTNVSFFSLQITADSNLTVRYNHTYQMSLPVAINILGSAMYKIASNDPTVSPLFSLNGVISFDKEMLL